MSADFKHCQGKPFWKSHDGMHLHSDTDTYFGGGSQKFGGKTPQRHHRREVEGYDGGNHSDRASHLFNNNTSVPSSKKTSCDGLSQNSAPQRKTGLSMFITIIHYFYLLEWPQVWGGIHRYSMFLEKPVSASATVPISTPHGTKRPWQPPRFGQPADPASPWQRRPSPGLARSQIAEQNETKLDTEITETKLGRHATAFF